MPPFSEIVYFFDVIGIFATVANFAAIIWVWFKVDDMDDDLEDLQEDFDGMGKPVS